MTSATLTLMLGLSWGGVHYPWISAPITILLAASASLWAAFALRLLSAREPLIPLAILADRVVGTATLTSALGMGTYVGLSITVPIYFETRLGLSARESGLALIPLMVGVTIGATASGRAMAAVRHYKRLPLAGMALALGSVAAMAAGGENGALWRMELLLFTFSTGLGTVFPVATVATQNAVLPHHLGTATATMNFSRQLAGAIIVAVYGAVALGAGDLSLERAGHGAAGGQGGAFTTVFWLATAGIALALVVFAFMEERPFRERNLPDPGVE